MTYLLLGFQDASKAFQSRIENAWTEIRRSPAQLYHQQLQLADYSLAYRKQSGNTPLKGPLFHTFQQAKFRA